VAHLIGFAQLQLLQIQQDPDCRMARAEVPLLHQQLFPRLNLTRECDFFLAGEQVDSTDVLQIQAQQVVATAPADRGMPRRSGVFDQETLDGSLSLQG